MTQLREDLLGVSVDRAAALADISPRRLREWDEIGLVSPEVKSKVGARTIRLYGFEQLVELRMVRALAERGRPTHQIHRVVDAYRSFTAHPLRELRWAVSGKDIFVQFPDGSWYGGRRPAQGVMEDVLDLDQIRNHLRRDLAQKRGRQERGRIEKRRGTHRSKPVFAGTRTPVAAVQSYLRRDIPESDILEAFPHLSREDIRAARDALAI